MNCILGTFFVGRVSKKCTHLANRCLTRRNHTQSCTSSCRRVLNAQLIVARLKGFTRSLTGVLDLTWCWCTSWVLFGNVTEQLVRPSFKGQDVPEEGILVLWLLSLHIMKIPIHAELCIILSNDLNKCRTWYSSTREDPEFRYYQRNDEKNVYKKCNKRRIDKITQVGILCSVTFKTG